MHRGRISRWRTARLHACLDLVTRGTIVLGFAALGGAARPAAADELAPEAIRLVYVAPDGCPDDASFFAGLAARARAVRVESGADRTFTVTIVGDDRGAFQGTLAVTSTDGTTTRDVSGAT